MADEASNREGFRIQEYYCRQNASPIYARIGGALAEGLNRDSAVGRRVLDWPGEPTRDALPLRLIGGLHALVLAGKDEPLAAVLRGEISDPAAVTDILNKTLITHDAALLPWLNGPPQTNEPGRSAALMTGLIEVARALGPKLELLEIGSSAGLNLLIDRYRIDLGGTVIGPADAPVSIVPDWQGDAPQAPSIEIVSVRGCDVAPMDATDPAVEARLAAYVWVEEPERLERVHAAIAMLRQRDVDLVRADAADWVEARLAEPQTEGVTRVLMHSVVWQYLPETVAERIRVAMKAAGEQATRERPLAWVMMEPDRALGYQVIRLRHWPDDNGWIVVGTSHAHGRWIKPGEPDCRDGIDIPESAKVKAG